MLTDFKTFLLRGNVVDLAVAVVIGSAFGTVVSAMVKNLITPLVAAIGGKPNFGNLKFTINNSEFLYGEFLNELLAFVIIAAVVFFFVIQPMNHLIKFANRRAIKGESDELAKNPQLVILEEIRDLLRKQGKQ